MKFVKKLLKVVMCVVASFFISLIGNESMLETGKFTEQQVAAWLFVFFIMIFWRWVGRFVKSCFKTILLIFGLSRK